MSDDFAAEMFVIINSTPTRINKSHLIDLYERVSWTEPDRRFAAHIVEMLYREPDSPLRYRINRLGGRSQQAAEHFRGLGFTRLFNVTGGIDAWATEVDSSIGRY